MRPERPGTRMKQQNGPTSREAGPFCFEFAFHSFPRSAWERDFRRSVSSGSQNTAMRVTQPKTTQSVKTLVPTQSVGTSCG